MIYFKLKNGNQFGLLISGAELYAVMYNVRNQINGSKLKQNNRMK